MRTASLMGSVLVVVAMGAGGCAAKRVETAPERVATGTSSPAAQPGPAAPATSVSVPGLEPTVVFYALDSAQLDEASQLALQRVASVLRADRSLSVSLAGHTCELGTEEYNLALGYKRANAARDYLVRLGVQDRQVSVTSYGELRPATPGTNEASLAKNRRTEVAPERVVSSAR